MRRRLRKATAVLDRIFEQLWTPLRSSSVASWYVAGRRNFRAPIRQTYRFEFPELVQVYLVRLPRDIEGFWVPSLRVDGVEQIDPPGGFDAKLLSAEHELGVKLDQGRVVELDIERLPGEASHDRVLVYLAAHSVELLEKLAASGVTL